MELKLHSDEDGFKSAELVSATLPKGSVSSLEPAHSTTEAIRGLLWELTLYNFDETTEEYRFVEENLKEIEG